MVPRWELSPVRSYGSPLHVAQRLDRCLPLTHSHESSLESSYRNLRRNDVSSRRQLYGAWRIGGSARVESVLNIRGVVHPVWLDSQICRSRRLRGRRRGGRRLGGRRTRGWNISAGCRQSARTGCGRGHLSCRKHGKVVDGGRPGYDDYEHDHDGNSADADEIIFFHPSSQTDNTPCHAGLKRMES